MLRRPRRVECPEAGLVSEAEKQLPQRAVPPRRPPLRLAARICVEDASGSLDPALVRTEGPGLERRADAVRGLLAGDALAVTSAGLSVSQCAALCQERVPWPFSAQGGGPLGVPARSSSPDGALALGCLMGLADERLLPRHGAEAHAGIGAAAGCAADRIAALWGRSVRHSGVDTTTMCAASRLTTETEGIRTAAGTADAPRRPHQSSAAALGRAIIAAAVFEPRMGALDACVGLTLITHATPEEVVCGALVCICAYALLHDEPTPLTDPGADGAAVARWAERVLLSPAPEHADSKGVSCWAAWKHGTEEPLCREWLQSQEGSEELTRAEKRVAAAVGNVKLHNPFAAARDEQRTCRHTLCTALWALHYGAVERRFPERLTGWIRRVDYDPPPKYRTRLTKERRLAELGLALPPKQDHPGGGDLWNALDAPGGFQAIMWAALTGGEGCTAATAVAGALLGAHCGVPERWGAESAAAQAAVLVLRHAVGEGPVEPAPEWLNGAQPVERLEGAHLLRRLEYALAPSREDTTLFARVVTRGAPPSECDAQLAAWICSRLPADLREPFQRVRFGPAPAYTPPEGAAAAPPPSVTVARATPISAACRMGPSACAVLPFSDSCSAVCGSGKVFPWRVAWAQFCWAHALRCTTACLPLWPLRLQSGPLPAWLASRLPSLPPRRCSPGAPSVVAAIHRVAVLWREGADSQSGGWEWVPTGERRLLSVVCASGRRHETEAERAAVRRRGSAAERTADAAACATALRSALAAAAAEGAREVAIADPSCGETSVAHEDAASGLLAALAHFPGAFDKVVWCVPPDEEVAARFAASALGCAAPDSR
eukprot:TRINITY_DN7099_c0_g1_i1.p1 TRINITY_DN7099_c0_g1~~TRINITY_DN7099_c0_g1_i1.p1  ORF type:complete len:869 (+),score=186.68 TRINITY_DN7099_c0_g1_i1:110-2608(+)